MDLNRHVTPISTDLVVILEMDRFLPALTSPSRLHLPTLHSAAVALGVVVEEEDEGISTFATEEDGLHLKTGAVSALASALRPLQDGTETLLEDVAKTGGQSVMMRIVGRSETNANGNTIALDESNLPRDSIIEILATPILGLLHPINQ